MCLGSSMVERATVNREVVGSSPIRDVILIIKCFVVGVGE